MKENLFSLKKIESTENANNILNDCIKGLYLYAVIQFVLSTALWGFGIHSIEPLIVAALAYTLKNKPTISLAALFIAWSILVLCSTIFNSIHGNRVGGTNYLLGAFLIFTSIRLFQAVRFLNRKS